MSHMKLCVAQQRLGKKPEPGFEQAGKLCATQSGQVKLCATQSGEGSSVPHMKLCVTQSGQAKLCVTYEALCCTIGTRGSSVLHNNGWVKSRNPALNRQESSVSHNQDKQSSVSQMKLCVAQSGQVKLCVTKGPGKKPEPGFEQAEKLCVT